MPYPNNLDVYDSDLIIQQSEIYSTAQKKVAFFENAIKEATNNFNSHLADILKFGWLIKLGDREFDTRGQIPNTTHGDYYKEDYEKFIKEIQKAISELQENIDIEKDLQACEYKDNIEDKTLAFVRLRKIYNDFLCGFEITLNDANNKMYNNYNNALISIEKRISELTNLLSNSPNEKENKSILTPTKDEQLKENRQTRIVDIEKLNPYFTSTFKGLGNNLNHFSTMINELQIHNDTGKGFAQIALMIYESGKLNSRKPTTFSSWYSVFCECVGIEKKKDYKPSNLKPFPQKITNLFSYL